MDQRVVSYRSRSMQQPYVPDHNYQGLHPRDPAYPPADPGYPFRPDMPYPGADQPIYSNLDLPLSQTLDALKGRILQESKSVSSFVGIYTLI